MAIPRQPATAADARAILDPMRPEKSDPSRAPVLRRRTFLELSGATALSLGALGIASSKGCRVAGPTPFRWGVASGDPLDDRVVLWTRVAPPDGGGDLAVDWWIGESADPARATLTGSVRTGADRDYTVKVDAQGLAPGRTWHYGFAVADEGSPAGRTRTLPVSDTARLQLAVVSCANKPQGYFTVYRHVAERDDVDLVLHLGDYIYEYADGVYGESRKLGRSIDPPHEVVTLDDYRRRYACYREDPDLQALHQRHPMVAVWDDHESANNAWQDGAQNHDASEGDWKARRAAAIRAYREWLPVREPADPADDRTWRRLRFGDLADLLMLDTRLAGRDEQAARGDREAAAAPGRQLLGAEQEAWLFSELDRSTRDGVAWRLLGQQVVMGQLALPGAAGNPDAWDGYPDARRRLLDHLAQADVDDVVVLSGDVHSSWALDVAPDPYDPAVYDPATGRGSLAVEMVTPAVSSSPLAKFERVAKLYANATAERPHLKFLDLTHRGFLRVDLTRDRMLGEWYFAEDVTRPGAPVTLAWAWRCDRGTAHLVKVKGPDA
jgi:alkaline phosphatase D